MKLFDSKHEKIEKSIRFKKDEIEFYNQKILLIELDIMKSEKELRQL